MSMTVCRDKLKLVNEHKPVKTASAPRPKIIARQPDLLIAYRAPPAAAW